MTKEETAKKKSELSDEIMMALLVAFSVEAELDAATNKQTNMLDMDAFPANVKDEAMQWRNYPDLKRIEESYSTYLDGGELDFGVFKKNLKAAIQAAIVKILNHSHQTEYFKVFGIDDEEQCEACKELQGKIFTMSGSDPRYPKIDQFLTNEGLHPNCRCYLREIKAPKLTIKELTKMAMNTKNIEDEVLYTTLVEDPQTGDDIPTYDFGESLVQIAPIGIFQGTTPDGGAMEENITKEALDMVLANYDGSEILLDVDHRSMRSLDSDTKAAGWIYDLKVVDGLGRLDGLYGRIRWTDYGRRLIETREYRFISPVFKVADGMPFMLVNAGLTNRPALETIMPILNSKTQEGETMIMKTEEEKETKGETKKETKEDKVTETKNACSKEDDKEVKNTETSETEKKEEVKEEVTKGEVKEEKEETKEEVKEEKKEKEEEEEEVIKIEVLNQAPEKAVEKTITSQDKLQKALSLKGKAFFDYLKANPDIR